MSSMSYPTWAISATSATGSGPSCSSASGHTAGTMRTFEMPCSARPVRSAWRMPADGSTAMTPLTASASGSA
jgi:hypothetical protein